MGTQRIPDLELADRPVDPARVLPAGTGLRAAFERTAGDTLVLVAGEHELAAVSELALRRALQEDGSGGRSVGELVDARLACDDEGAARALLGADAELAACLVHEGPRVVERRLPAVRRAIVMAGGLGQRLLPLTEDRPKPMLEVAGRPLLFRSLDALEAHGVEEAWISVRHLGDHIREAVEGAGEWGLAIDWLEEDEPLDTGAGLVQLAPQDECFYVVNGDILTALDLRALARAHLCGAKLCTVATYLYAAALPYGLVERAGGRVTRIAEKPSFDYPVNAGVYVFSPEVHDLVARGEPLALVDFLTARIAAGDLVGSFPLVEYWNDIGTHADYERAQRDYGAA